MHVAGNLIRMLSKGLEFIGGLFQRFAMLLSNLLPAMLSPVDLTSLIKSHYDESYTQTAQHFTTDVYEWTLEGWEQEAVHRHGIALRPHTRARGGGRTRSRRSGAAWAQRGRSRHQ